MEGHLPRSFYISISIHSHTLIAIWIWPITQLLKDLRIPLFPFLRLNDVVSDRVSSLLTFYLSRLYRLLHFRLLHMFLHRAGRGGGPRDNLHLPLHPADRGGDPRYHRHLFLHPMDAEGGLRNTLYNPSKDSYH